MATQNAISVNTKKRYKRVPLTSHMIWTLLIFLLHHANAYSYDWARLHSCLTPQKLKETVLDYSKHFPCLECREHFVRLVDTHPFPLNFVKTTEDARVWTWMTHNLVNMRLNKTWESFDIMLECQKEPIKPTDL